MPGEIDVDWSRAKMLGTDLVVPFTAAPDEAWLDAADKCERKLQTDEPGSWRARPTVEGLLLAGADPADDVRLELRAEVRRRIVEIEKLAAAMRRAR